jgi:hypothetical protein
MSIEEPPYSIERRAPYYEVRRYENTIVAETFVGGDLDEASRRGFKVLADYIFGKNESQTKIAMTAPVSLSGKGDKQVLQFSMPRSFSMQKLPRPLDQKVHLREIPSRRIAVYRYSGSWSQQLFDEKLQFFLSELNKDSVSIKGEPIFARFNSPFSLWFLRRNEIWIQIEDSKLPSNPSTIHGE